MKKHLVFFAFFVVYSSFGQQSPEDGHEAKLNVFNLIASKSLDASYEYILNEEASVGLGVLVALNTPDGNSSMDADDDSIFDYKRTFSATPYYRQFFSSGYAQGFFLEAFGMFNMGTHFDYVYDDIREMTVMVREKYADLAFGISAGGKFITPRGFTAEIYGGIGRNLLDHNHAPEVIFRGGLSVGYRF